LRRSTTVEHSLARIDQIQANKVRDKGSRPARRTDDTCGDVAVPADCDLRLISTTCRAQDVDDSALAAAPSHFHVHFTLTSASWLNRVEQMVCRAHPHADQARHPLQHDGVA
jgi:hypothetical protein